MLDSKRDRLKELYDRHYCSLVALACRLLHDKDAATDAVHDAFVVASENLAEAEDDGKWLYGIVSNLCRRRLRDLATARRNSNKVAILDSVVANTDPEIERAELAAIVQRELGELRENERLALTLHESDGLTHVQIAAAMSSSPGTVGSWIYRGKARLRAKLSVSAKAWLCA